MSLMKRPFEYHPGFVPSPLYVGAPRTAAAGREKRLFMSAGKTGFKQLIEWQLTEDYLSSVSTVKLLLEYP